MRIHWLHSIISNTGTIVEATTHGIGRDAEKMCVVAQRTAVNIVMGAGISPSLVRLLCYYNVFSVRCHILLNAPRTGHYVGAVHPPSIADESVEAIERRLCAEITDGLDGTNIKASLSLVLSVSLSLSLSLCVCMTGHRRALWVRSAHHGQYLIPNAKYVLSLSGVYICV
jgi:hypothetical protein